MVERIAGMLDYFMMFLAGPERKKLRIKDPERLGFKPKELLTQITDIYLHLTQGDPAGVFHEAVARDARSYRDQVRLIDQVSEYRDQVGHAEASLDL
jgi:ubiquitin conjugation factor E4 B